MILNENLGTESIFIMNLLSYDIKKDFSTPCGKRCFNW